MCLSATREKGDQLTREKFGNEHSEIGRSGEKKEKKVTSRRARETWGEEKRKKRGNAISERRLNVRDFSNTVNCLPPCVHGDINVQSSGNEN